MLRSDHVSPMISPLRHTGVGGEVQRRVEPLPVRSGEERADLGSRS